MGTWSSTCSWSGRRSRRARCVLLRIACLAVQLRQLCAGFKFSMLVSSKDALLHLVSTLFAAAQANSARAPSRGLCGQTGTSLAFALISLQFGPCMAAAASHRLHGGIPKIEDMIF